MKQEITFKEVYQLPLHIDKYCPIYVYSSNRVMTFNVNLDNEDKAKEVLSVINGDAENKYENVEYKDGRIFVDCKPLFLIRGWGHLTGCGGLNLPSETAAKIQDDFGNWIVGKLKGE